jgi:Family of unknown function (DUF5641)
MQENFWKQWQNDYPSNLVIRGKWNTQKPNLKIGELVMIKDKTQSPLKWPLARVVELYEGPDGQSSRHKNGKGRHKKGLT